MDPHDNRQDESDRRQLLDVLASMADRSLRSDAIKFQIELVHRNLTEKLSNKTPHAFETIGYGLKRCGISLPFKAPMYATLAGLITVGSEPYAEDLAKKLVDAVVKDLASAIRDGRASLARRALRFLACLGCSSVVSPTSVAEYVLVLLEAALFELTTANRSPYGVHCRGEFLADIALSVLPWAGAMLMERVPEQLAKIVGCANDIGDVWVSGRWRCVSPATERRCMESFSELLETTLLLQDAGWECPESIVPRPYKEFELQLGGGHEIAMPALSIPGHSKLTRYSAPRFRMFLVNARPEIRKGPRVSRIKTEAASPIDKTNGTEEKAVEANEENVIDVDSEESKQTHADSTSAVNAKQQPTEMEDVKPTLKAENVVKDVVAHDVIMSSAVDPDAPKTPKTPAVPTSSERTPIDEYVLRSYIADVVENFSSNHVMAAERLLTIPMLKKADDEIVEGLFSQLCSMPDPTFAPVYYGTLFVDLCRVKDSRLPIRLLTAVEAMFQDAGQLDPEAFDRLTEWFSFHLSNFEYKWNWSDWALYADAEMVDKFPYRALFCKDVLARCIRLSYYERVLAIIPEDMRFFLPPKPTSGDQSRFEKSVNNALMAVVTGKEKQEAKVVMERLRSLIPTPTVTDAEQQEAAETHAVMLRLSSLIRAILLAGCKTLSHFDTVAERYLSLLLEMSRVGGVPARRLITLEVSCFWKDVHIRRLYVLDKLSMHRVIDGLAVIDSVLSEEKAEGKSMIQKSDQELKEMLEDSSCWEILRLVMQRARAREDGARSELATASQAAAAANEGEAESAEARLENAKAGIKSAMHEISELLILALRRLFFLCGRLLGEAPPADEKAADGEKRILPGFDNRPIWLWRCYGMIRELARKHPRHVTTIIERLEEDTRSIREAHKGLRISFEIVREIESCALLPKVW